MVAVEPKAAMPELLPGFAAVDPNAMPPPDPLPAPLPAPNVLDEGNPKFRPPVPVPAPAPVPVLLPPEAEAAPKAGAVVPEEPPKVNALLLTVVLPVLNPAEAFPVDNSEPPPNVKEGAGAVLPELAVVSAGEPNDGAAVDAPAPVPPCENALEPKLGAAVAVEPAAFVELLLQPNEKACAPPTQ